MLVSAVRDAPPAGQLFVCVCRVSSLSAYRTTIHGRGGGTWASLLHHPWIRCRPYSFARDSSLHLCSVVRKVRTCRTSTHSYTANGPLYRYATPVFRGGNQSGRPDTGAPYSIQFISFLGGSWATDSVFSTCPSWAFQAMRLDPRSLAWLHAWGHLGAPLKYGQGAIVFHPPSFQRPITQGIRPGRGREQSISSLLHTALCHFNFCNFLIAADHGAIGRIALTLFVSLVLIVIFFPFFLFPLFAPIVSFCPAIPLPHPTNASTTPGPSLL